MTLPGSQVVFLDTGQPRSLFIDTGQSFIIAESERGPVGASLVTSMSQLARDYGSRQAYSYLFDVCETAFAEGASRLWVSRVLAATAVTASLALLDSVPATTLTVRAKNPGDWGNGAAGGLAVSVVVAGANRTLNVYLNNTLVETITFTAKADAIAWGQTTARYVDVLDGAGTGLPVALAQTNLAGGLSNRGAIVDADWQAALDRCGSDLGPGQVCMPGQTTSTRHLMLIAHALSHVRHALLDAPDTSAVSTVSSAAATARAAPGNGGRWASMYWPWHVIRGLTVASTRVVPPCAAMLGLAGRIDSQGNPNRPMAGERFFGGQLQYVDSLTQSPLSDADRETLNDGGVNVFLRFASGRPVNYGNRTLRDATVDPVWSQVSGSRLAMSITALGGNVIRPFVHEQIDGRGVTQNRLAGLLAAMLADLFERGALYGDQAEDAFSVDVGPQINPPEQIAAGVLKAAIQYKSSVGSDVVRLELVRRGLTEPVGV